MKKIIILVSIVYSMGMQAAFGQVESINSIYPISRGLLFPALSGNDSTSSVTAFSRQQWFGFKGAPTTYGVHYSGKILHNMGVGVVALHDQAGPIKNTLVGGDYSYRLRLGRRVSVLGGIRVGVINHSIAFRDLQVIHDGDPNLQQNYTTGFQLNAGWSAAMEIGKFFVAFSEPRIRRFKFKDDSGNTSNFIDATNYYAMSGYRWETKSLDIEPSVLIRLAQNIPVSSDFNLTLRYRKVIDLSMIYRTKSSYGARLGILTGKKLYFTYLYEVPSALGAKAGYQSHELALKYLIRK